jgi:septal ring factor EnvC (AmiA/AmiB activator)
VPDGTEGGLRPDSVSPGNRFIDEWIAACDKEDEMSKNEISPYRDDRAALTAQIDRQERDIGALEKYNEQLEAKLTDKRSAGLKLAITQGSIQLSASALIYLTVAGAAATFAASPPEALLDHPYLALWLSGLNLLVVTITGAIRRHG